jgi:outer membrane protein OmpA-like peptidoglycan-associated protein
MIREISMYTFTFRGVARSAAIAALSLLAFAADAAPWGPDVAGGKDHPLVKRFAGSWLVGFKHVDYDQAVIPAAKDFDRSRDYAFKQTQTVEGEVTRLFYMAPKGKSPLEVQRNYEQALVAAGLQRKFSCDKDCGEPAALHLAMESTGYDNGVAWIEGNDIGIPIPSGGMFPMHLVTDGPDVHLLYGTLNKGGRLVHVLLYTTKAGNADTDYAGTYLEIVESKPMQTGQVTVDAKALQAGLATEGKIALYGIYFDSGKAEVKPESNAQLAEMAKLLQSQPALKVYIVGHTDNQGSLEGNMSLSQQRAQAVVAALAGPLKVDGRRLRASGVASLAPVATNVTEEGRARNRRVELVVQ